MNYEELNFSQKLLDEACGAIIRSKLPEDTIEQLIDEISEVQYKIDNLLELEEDDKE